jgi:hypothetical protein
MELLPFRINVFLITYNYTVIYFNTNLNAKNALYYL